MAIIQKIRNRAGLLVAVVIGAALVAFILGDFLQQGNVSFRSSSNNIAEVNGKGLPVNLYYNHLSQIENVNKLLRNTSSLDEQTSNAVKEQTWQNLINDRIMGREYDKLGLTVHSDELASLILGDNPHQIVQQFFADPNSGGFNPAMVRQFWQNTNQVDGDNNQMQIRLYIENIIDRDRKLRKYNTLLNKGMYATSLEAKRKKSEFNKTVDFSYLVKRYTEAADTNIAVLETELKAYYKKHKEEYKQEQGRDVRYVEWEVKPTEKDIQATEEWINDAAKEFEALEADGTFQFVKANSDLSPEDKNFMRGELPENVDEFAFNAEEGDIFGPYFEDNQYRVAKLSKIDFLPDSVRASHILLQANQENVQTANALADSLKKLIENGADFAQLARDNSSDGSRLDGGDLGWFQEGKMVKPFNDSAFYGKTGDIKKVFSQFGIHILKITAQSRKVKKVKVGILARDIRTDDADNIYFMKANEFGGLNRTTEQFDDALGADQSLVVINAANVKKSDQNINGLENSRQLVRWIYNAKEEDITTEVYQFGNKYVVAILDKIREDEYMAFEDVKESIEIEVKKQKQGEKLIAELKKISSDASDINAAASKLGVEVKSATNIRFSSYSIPQLGAEPKLIAAAVNLEKGKLSNPIEGQNGVYLIQVDNFNEGQASEDFTYEKTNIERGFGSRVNFNSASVLNELANVEDNRINFF